MSGAEVAAGCVRRVSEKGGGDRAGLGKPIGKGGLSNATGITICAAIDGFPIERVAQLTARSPPQAVSSAAKVNL